MASIRDCGDGLLAVTGELSFDSVAALREQGNTLLAAGSGPCRVDLAGVSFGSSAGVSLLLCWVREARARGRALQYLNLPAGMVEIARVTGVDDLLPVA